MNDLIYYYINLEKRIDRKQHLINQFIKFNIDRYERINAIHHIIGHIGCTLSHIVAIEKFIQSDYNYAIILEDDFEFIISTEQYYNLLEKLYSSNLEWNIVLLSANIMKSKPYNDFLQTCIEAQTTSGYIVSKPFAKTLLQNYREGLDLYLSENGKQQLHSIDQYWKKLQGENSNWFIFNPKCGRQMRSFSDIENRETFYGC